MIDNKEMKIIRVLYRLGLVQSYRVDASVNWRGGGDLRIMVRVNGKLHKKYY